MELKEKLAALRVEKGLSQAELAEALDVSRQAISRWEVGTSVPSMDNLIRLSKLYGVSLDTFVCDREEEVQTVEPAGPARGDPSRMRRLVRNGILAACVLALVILIVFVGVQYLSYSEDHGTEGEVLDIEALESVDLLDLGETEDMSFN